MPYVTTLLCARCSRPAPALSIPRAYLSRADDVDLAPGPQDAAPPRFPPSSTDALCTLFSETNMQDAQDAPDAARYVSQAPPISQGGLRAMIQGRHRGYMCDECDTQRMLRRVDRQRGGHGASLDGLRRAAERKRAALRLELGGLRAETREAASAEKEVKRVEGKLLMLGGKARENGKEWDDEVRVWEGFGAWMAADKWSEQGKGEAASGGGGVWSGWEEDSEDEHEDAETEGMEEDEDASMSDSDSDSGSGSDYDSVAAERDDLEVLDEGSVDSGTDECESESEDGDEYEAGTVAEDLSGPDMDDEDMTDAY